MRIPTSAKYFLVVTAAHIAISAVYAAEPGVVSRDKGIHPMLFIANAPIPGQQSTVAWAINDLNEFTGYWYDAQGNEHGFVALAIR